MNAGTNRGHHTTTTETVVTKTHYRSTDMHTLNEALARDRQREARWRARREQDARTAPSERRWHRVALTSRTRVSH